MNYFKLILNLICLVLILSAGFHALSSVSKGEGGPVSQIITALFFMMLLALLLGCDWLLCNVADCVAKWWEEV